MANNPFDVEVGEFYLYSRPGWEYASVVVIEDCPEDAYGLGVRNLSAGILGFKFSPASLKLCPNDAVFVHINRKL